MSSTRGPKRDQGRGGPENKHAIAIGNDGWSVAPKQVTAGALDERQASEATVTGGPHRPATEVYLSKIAATKGAASNSLCNSGEKIPAGLLKAVDKPFKQTKPVNHFDPRRKLYPPSIAHDVVMVP